MKSKTAVNRLEELEELTIHLISARSVQEKIKVLEGAEEYKKYEKTAAFQNLLPYLEDPKTALAIKSVLAIGEGPIVFRVPEGSFVDREKLKKLLKRLKDVDAFYEEIGGIAGYHYNTLKLLKESEKTPSEVEKTSTEYLMPAGYDLEKGEKELNRYVRWGIEKLSEMAEIYPVGGAGDRLQLVDEATGEALPAADLQFTGFSLLELLIQDLEAKEYLHYKLTGKQVLTPVAMMTSEEKDNHNRIIQICEKNNWFGRPKESFCFFTQPLVPVITKEGHWSLSDSFVLKQKPGGHGAIWKLMLENKVFDWLKGKKRKKALLRQINNPVAGTDAGILAFCGIGCAFDKSFGFASCSRVLNTAQGMLVTVKEKKNEEYEYFVSNIEYTDFSKKGLKDLPEKSGSNFSKYPANTNILFVDLQKIKEAIPFCPVPGMVVNFKNNTTYIDENGASSEVKGGRLESTMQNISDCFKKSSDHPLSEEELVSASSFTTYYDRKKTISVTKNAFDPSKSFQETPLGCFYEVLQNNCSLFSNNCKMDLPPLCTEKAYIEKGPNLILLFHPSLGPLWSIIRQKIRGGKLAEGAEMQLQIADADLENVELDGSLIINADQPLGKNPASPHSLYSELCGKCELINVKVSNHGIDRFSKNTYWKNQIKRKESLHITLQGNAEFFAENMTFRGNFQIFVPDGHRMVAFQEKDRISFKTKKISSPSWKWEYVFLEDNRINLGKKFL